MDLDPWEEILLERYLDGDLSIWSELGEAIDKWRRVYESFWGLGKGPRPEYLEVEEWSTVKLLDALGARFVELSLTLDAAPTVTELPAQDFDPLKLKELRRSIRAQAKAAIISDRMSIDLAEAAVGQLAESTWRARRLLSFIRKHPVGYSAREFLGHAARLYVWGFEPECVIVCRSVLETALITRLARDDLLDPDKPPPPLYELIGQAGKEGVLPGFEPTQDGKHWRARRGTPLRSAERLRKTGRYLVHELPLLQSEEDHLPDAFSALRELSRVLDILFPG
jgi:hypothetical protein